jgi:zinc-binding alcohol dehydrogenase family protein
MRAVASLQALPIDHPESLVDLELPEPELRAQDLRVSVQAVSVNPVDYKIRQQAPAQSGTPRVLGWDAAGIVEAVGPAVTRFNVGDRVWYAGAIDRPGSNSALQVVDERLVGPMPESLGFAEAAALPLTAITAWELLFERLAVPAGKRPSGDTLLITGAGGGVGSILVQLARRLTGLRVIATAGRPETERWLRELGAHEVIDHRQPLGEGLKRIGLSEVSMVASLTHTEQHYGDLVAALAPQGKLALIDDPQQPLDARALKRKSLSLHWELMFTRSLYQTADMDAQHRLLTEVAQLVDAGVLRSTLAQHLGSINSANLRRAHAELERGSARGKIVLEGFGAAAS